MSKHPMQPLEMVGAVLRFKKNAIVRDLLDHGERTGLGLNELARSGKYSTEDWAQLCQLIGYSHSGANAYLTTDELDVSLATYEAGETEQQARARVAEERIERLRAGLREAVADLYDIHPDDLQVKPTAQL